ncbi:MAG: hypothetical protein A3G24_28780 [Betaproteobacteria bacterium RIFCSPLOWO2_12_FULL_62_13]|nr:MAG: hypothetical protein A3G24_28780 [Betaproteobacteria bacterium RIFCSPLOWO2_12_FULL_62_13]
MKTALRFIAQALLYLPFMVLIGYFSTSPAYRHLGADQALIRLSFSHAAQRIGECRQRTPEELAKLPPNMRAPLVCPRERAPVAIELEIDGKLVYQAAASPSGFTRDGAATVYQRLPIAAGRHRFTARLNDRVAPGFHYERDVTLDLEPGRVLVIDFNASQGGFLFK